MAKVAVRLGNWDQASQLENSEVAMLVVIPKLVERRKRERGRDVPQ
jgi:hypothetical protein